jgi:hypothetical protein
LLSNINTEQAINERKEYCIGIRWTEGEYRC